MNCCFDACKRPVYKICNSCIDQRNFCLEHAQEHIIPGHLLVPISSLSAKKESSISNLMKLEKSFSEKLAFLISNPKKEYSSLREQILRGRISIHETTDESEITSILNNLQSLITESSISKQAKKFECPDCGKLNPNFQSFCDFPHINCENCQIPCKCEDCQICNKKLPCSLCKICKKTCCVYCAELNICKFCVKCFFCSNGSVSENLECGNHFSCLGCKEKFGEHCPVCNFQNLNEEKSAVLRKKSENVEAARLISEEVSEEVKNEPLVENSCIRSENSEVKEGKVCEVCLNIFPQELFSQIQRRCKTCQFKCVICNEEALYYCGTQNHGLCSKHNEICHFCSNNYMQGICYECGKSKIIRIMSCSHYTCIDCEADIKQYCKYCRESLCKSCKTPGTQFFLTVPDSSELKNLIICEKCVCAHCKKRSKMPNTNNLCYSCTILDFKTCKICKEKTNETEKCGHICKKCSLLFKQCIFCNNTSQMFFCPDCFSYSHQIIILKNEYQHCKNCLLRIQANQCHFCQSCIDLSSKSYKPCGYLVCDQCTFYKSLGECPKCLEMCQSKCDFCKKIRFCCKLMKNKLLLCPECYRSPDIESKLKCTGCSEVVLISDSINGYCLKCVPRCNLCHKAKEIIRFSVDVRSEWDRNNCLKCQRLCLCTKCNKIGKLLDVNSTVCDFCSLLVECFHCKREFQSKLCHYYDGYYACQICYHVQSK